VLDVQALAQRLGPARTLHCLGAQPHTRQMRHHAGHRAVDVLLVDEASMVHLEMMAALLDALPASARLVLLGDKDQLASVEAGVLGDLCRDAAAGRYSTETRRYLQATTGQTLPDALLEAAPGASPGTAHGHAAQKPSLWRPHRRAGAGREPGRCAPGPPCAGRRPPGCRAPAGQQRSGGGRATGPARPLGCGRLLRAMAVPVPAQEDAHTAWVQGVLRAFDGFRLLCAVREGPWGVPGSTVRSKRPCAARASAGGANGMQAAR
jgi:exodeoxyribonuclease V alpha subunit